MLARRPVCHHHCHQQFRHRDLSPGHSGINNLIATEPEQKDGEFTGKVSGLPCFREGKIARLESWLDEHNLTWLSFLESWFYSDSLNDIPLLNKGDSSRGGGPRRDPQGPCGKKRLAYHQPAIMFRAFAMYEVQLDLTNFTPLVGAAAPSVSDGLITWRGVERIAAMIARTHRPAAAGIFFFLLGLPACLPGCYSAAWTFLFRRLPRRCSLPADSSMSHQIVWQLRLPRVLAAFACGGLLALAGALLQVLLRNPLADPYILGVSGGAAVGALACDAAGMGIC